MKNILVIALLFLFIHCSQPQNTQFSEKALNSKITTVEGDQMTLGQLLKKHKGVPVVIDVKPENKYLPRLRPIYNLTNPSNINRQHFL